MKELEQAAKELLCNKWVEVWDQSAELATLGEFAVWAENWQSSQSLNFPSDKGEQLSWFIINAVRLFDNEQLQVLAREIGDRCRCDGWISVEERLPEEGHIIDAWIGSNVRCQFVRGRFERYVDISKLDRVIFTINYTNVTHWQPLSKEPLNKSI